MLTVRVPDTKPKASAEEDSPERCPDMANKATFLVVRPSGTSIDVLLPTADADRQIQIRLADGVSFEPHAREPGNPGSPLPRLDIAVKTPPPLLEMAASVKPILEDWDPPKPPLLPRPPSLMRPLIDLAQARIAAAYHTLEHYQSPAGLMGRARPMGRAATR